MGKKPANSGLLNNLFKTQQANGIIKTYLLNRPFLNVSNTDRKFA